MISQTVEYALRAAVHLAHIAPESCTTQALAEATRAPIAYMSKVLQAMNKAEVVILRRGLGGGASLRKDPENITLLDIVNAVEPIKRVHTCPLVLKLRHPNLCPLHQMLDDAQAQVEALFAATTLDSLINRSAGDAPLCDD